MLEIKSFAFASILVVLVATPAFSQVNAPPSNATPKCLKRANAPSGAEYYIHPLKNFSYDVEMTYKLGPNDFPLKLTIIRKIRGGKPSANIDVRIARAIAPPVSTSNIQTTYREFKKTAYLFFNSAKPYGPSDNGGQIASAIMRGEKVKVTDNIKSAEINLDTIKMQQDFKAIEPDMRKMLDDEKNKICRNVYDFEQ